ncbi:hypothetical protein CI793_12250 [Anoxybacillus ayderensis]|uniref:hypothetical protein n=1 Tax=Anoxybacillus sp. ST70 TaxID=2864180 RepID=UPI0003690A11|nr:hypothetical protein [Anoxybacillus sp. ST70]AXM89903.1 hypothetical protein B379_12495 [Anoxybacillus ayderensis G10]MBW9219675.1 hypothetical protein [Anoxybacillus sp. ST70]THD15565.1 hypothetical protein CI793_12250 [Anoxybacillus ayderensis]
MNKLIHLFKFDIKLLGHLYSFPFVIYVLCMLLMLSFHARSNDPFMPYIVVQGIAVPIAGWHIVFLYNSLYEEGATEALFFYYRKVLITDIIRYVTLHGTFAFLLVGFIVWINGTKFFTVSLVIHFILLFIFYQIVGLAVLSAVKSLDVALAIIAMYTFMEVATQGTFMPWPHIFIFREPVDSISMFLPLFWLVIGIFLSVAQIWRTFK